MSTAIQNRTDLEANEKMFALLVAKGHTYSTAYRMAYPAKAKLKHSTIWTAANRLARKTEVSTEVEQQKARLASMTDKALSRLDLIIEHGKEHNALEASKFTVEQHLGKARQLTEVTGAMVHVTYDLSGGQAGPVPQEVIDQLKE